MLAAPDGHLHSNSAVLHTHCARSQLPINALHAGCSLRKHQPDLQIIHRPPHLRIQLEATREVEELVLAEEAPRAEVNVALLHSL